MKNTFFLYFFVAAAVIFSNCDDSFIEGQEYNYQQFQDTLFVLNDVVVEDLEFNFEAAGNGAYTIILFPGWLEFDTLEGKFTNGSTMLNFTTKNILFTEQMGLYIGTVEMKIEGFGILSIPVVYGNLGHPTLVMGSSKVEIGEMLSSQLTISNTSNGILFWEAGLLPHWLTLSETHGMIGPNESVSVILTVNRQDMEVGIYRETFFIYNNSMEKMIPVEVSMAVTKTTQMIGHEAIEGEVIDAAYLKERDLMVICTKIPNRLLVYDFSTGNRHVIDLDATPSCFDFSPDGKNAVVGYDLGAASRIDLQNMTVDKTIDIDCIPYDIVYGEDEWCYITPAMGQWTLLRNLNLNSGEIFVGASSIYEKTIIRKPVNSNLLIGTQLNVSPNGIKIFRINSNKLITDKVEGMHVDTWNFWLSEDGKRMFCGNRRIYKTPSLPLSSNSSLYGPDLQGLLDSKLGTINWIDHNQRTNSLFVAESEYYKPSVVEVFDASNYNLKHEIAVQNYTFNSNNYPADIKFVFSNYEGNLLFLIKNAINYNQPTKLWSLETLPVN